MQDDTTIIPLHQPGSIFDPLTEIAREGARRMLAAALRAEAASLRCTVRGRTPARWAPSHRAAWYWAGAADPDRDRPDPGAAPEGARPRRRRAGREKDPLHLDDPAALGAAIEEPRCPAAGSLPAGHLDRRLPGGADGTARARTRRTCRLA